jgi:hypothetical protein
MKRYTVLEAADRLVVTRSRIQSLISLQELPATRELETVMGIPDRVVWYIAEDDLLAYETRRATSRNAKRLPEFTPRTAESYSREELVDLGWLAGIIDGEGYISLTQKLTRSKSDSGKTWIGFTPTLIVAINSEKVCREGRRILGVGQVFLKSVRNGKEHWCWRCRNRDAVIALRMIAPFLRLKPDQAALVLEGAELNTNYQSQPEWYAHIRDRSAAIKKIVAQLLELHGQSGGHRVRTRSAELNSSS